MYIRKLPVIVIALALFFTVALPYTSVQLAEAASATSVVKWDTVQQTVYGFGGSGAFHKAGAIMRLKEPVRTQILDMIFSQNKGIGLSIVRSMVGDGGQWGSKEYDGPTQTIEPEKGVFVWDDPNWVSQKAEFDKYQIWFMNEAKKRGVTTFISSVWSPPAWMKTNNSVLGTDNGKLKPENYQDFADYLAEYVLGYKKHFNLDIAYISPANEPSYGASYSGCVWTAEEMNIFVRDYLGPTFKARGVKAKIAMPEHMNYTESYALPALNDPVTVNYVDVVATHAYGIGSSVPEFPVSKEKGKSIWQTEYMNQGTENQTFEKNTITDGLRYANLIGDMFDITGISAYFWWWPAANNGADGSDLIRLANDGSNQSVAPTENGLFRVFKRYYSFGNYSRFIRPGYVKIAADKNPLSDVMVTAYKDPRSGNFSIVAVNNNANTQTVTFQLDNFPGGVKAVVPYRTSANENLKKLDDIRVLKRSFTMELRGASVTTFIPEAFELPALKEMKDVFSTYEAEENDGQSSGLKVEATNQGGKMITKISNGDYLKYKNVNFADGSASGVAAKRYILSINAHVASMDGGTIEVRLDNPKDGKIVGTMAVPALHDPQRWITVSSMIDTNSADGAYGFHDMYVVFKGTKDKSMFHVDYFNFNDGNLAPPVSSSK